MPDWIIVIIGLAVGGVFTILGYFINGFLEQRREKIRSEHEDVRLIRESIANTYIEGAIRPIQRDLAINLAVIDEMSNSYTDLIVQLKDTRYSEDFIELLDEIAAAKLQWGKQTKALGVARLGLFGDEFQLVTLAAYRAIQSYYKVAHLLAGDLKIELQNTKKVSKESVTKMTDFNEEGLYQPCIDVVLRAIRDLDLLGQAIPALEMESHFDVLAVRWEGTELIGALRELAKKDAEDFENFEKSFDEEEKTGKDKGK